MANLLDRLEQQDRDDLAPLILALDGGTLAMVYDQRKSHIEVMISDGQQISSAVLATVGTLCLLMRWLNHVAGAWSEKIKESG